MSKAETILILDQLLEDMLKICIFWSRSTDYSFSEVKNTPLQVFEVKNSIKLACKF